MLDDRGKTGQCALRLHNVSVVAGLATALDRVSLDLAAGPMTLLLGPNGSGKTTLLKLAMGLIEPTSGAIDVRQPLLRTAFVFQRPAMLRRSVTENMAFSATAAGYPVDGGVISDLLRLVGLEGLGNRPARKLSGGEQQRLALARALIRQPDVLFLDEPTSSLDPAATKTVEDVVAGIVARSRAVERDDPGTGMRIVMATHDIGQARRLGGDVVLLVKGRVAEFAPAGTFFTRPASEAARQFLTGSIVL